MDVSLPLPWRCLPPVGAGGVCPSRRPRVSRCAYNGDWQRQAATVSGTLAALLQSLRRATLGERQRRLRAATLVQLRIISAGLRLRMSDSRPVLVQRIEDAFAEDDRLAQQPLGDKLLLNQPFTIEESREFQRLIAERLNAEKLKRLCRFLRLSTAGRKAQLASEITSELLERHHLPGLSAAHRAGPRELQGVVEPRQSTADSLEEDVFTESRMETAETATVLIPTVLANADERRCIQKEERRLQRRQRLAQILAEDARNYWRIQRELKEICESPSRHWTAGPATDDLFEWIALTPTANFEGGIYTGKIVLPVNYPLAPPSITLLTPSGRWEVGKKICLSNTNYHPDLWQPAWGIRTMMEALRSHFPVAGDGAIGALDWPSDMRKRLAQDRFVLRWFRCWISFHASRIAGVFGLCDTPWKFWFLVQKEQRAVARTLPRRIERGARSGGRQSTSCLKRAAAMLWALCTFALLLEGSCSGNLSVNLTANLTANRVNNSREGSEAEVLAAGFCEMQCKKANPDQPCIFDQNCPDLGCNALGFSQCRYCGFGAYVSVPCRGGPRPPPISTCRPEINVISQKPGDHYFANHISATGFQEQLQCSKLNGIGGANTYSCVTAMRRETRLRTAHFLQQLTFSADCKFFVKKVWRMSPQPVATCTEMPEAPQRLSTVESGELPPADEKKESQVPETPEVQTGPGPGPATTAPVNSGASGPPKAAPRRRREGERQRRSQQNLMVQLFKPPSTGRGRLLMSLNLLIVCVLVLLTPFSLGRLSKGANLFGLILSGVGGCHKESSNALEPTTGSKGEGAEALAVHFGTASFDGFSRQQRLWRKRPGAKGAKMEQRLHLL
eukprot:s408_g20.t1